MREKASRVKKSVDFFVVNKMIIIIVKYPEVLWIHYAIK